MVPQHFKTTVVTYAILTFAGGVSFMLPDSLTVTRSSGGAAPAEVQLVATVRDFVAKPSGLPSELTLDDWYAHVVQTGLSERHAITLSLDGSVYEYVDDGLQPSDGRLLDGRGQSADHFLTYDLEAGFTYDRYTGQFVQLEGGEGAWVFIDAALVIDLGGGRSAALERVDLDRLDLVDGRTYTMHLRYAQRIASSSDFRLRTNIELQSGDGSLTSAGVE